MENIVNEKDTVLEVRDLELWFNGDYGAVKIPDPQRNQNFLIPGIGHHRMGHIVRNPLHTSFAGVHRHHFVAQFLQLQRNRRSKPAKTNYQIRFHMPSSADQHSCFGKPITFLRPVGQQESQTDGHDSHTAKEHHYYQN